MQGRALLASWQHRDVKCIRMPLIPFWDLSSFLGEVWKKSGGSFHPGSFTLSSSFQK